MDLRVGMFVRFTDKDDSGKFSYDGEVVSLEHNEISFDIGIALLTIPVSEQGLLTEIERPTDFKRGTYAEKLPKLDPPPYKILPGSTRERVAEIVRQNPSASRKELIALCSEAGIGPGSASTYIALARKS